MILSAHCCFRRRHLRSCALASKFTPLMSTELTLIEFAVNVIAETGIEFSEIFMTSIGISFG